MIYCATDWIGMSSADIGNAREDPAATMSHFSTLVDRGEQGILDTLLPRRG